MDEKTSVASKTNVAYLSGLLAILGLGAVLRVYGIGWGLPTALHPHYSYHPDEMLTLVWAKSLIDGQIIGKHFIYGGTFYYSILNAFIYFGDTFAGVLGGINRLSNSILAGRYFLVAVALLTILLVYEIGHRAYGRKVGILAAFLLAMTPAHVVWAQRVRPDEIGALLAVLIFYPAMKILEGEEDRNYKYYVYSGLAIGISAATRFPLALFAIAPLAAHLIARHKHGVAQLVYSLFSRGPVTLVICALIGYAVASPHTFIYLDWFMEGMRIQWAYQSGVFLDAVEQGSGIYQYGWSMLSQALGYALYALAAAGMACAAIKRSRIDVLLLITIIPYFIVTTFASWVVVRYTLPILPFLVLLAARFAFYALDSIPRYRIGVIGALLLAVSWTMLGNMAYLRLEAEANIRDVAMEWLDKNITPGSSILTVEHYLGDYYFNPPISDKYRHMVFLLNEPGDSHALFENKQFDYLILNEYTYKNMERLGDRNPSRQMKIFYESLSSSPYKLIKEFKKPAEIIGINFSKSYSSNDYSIVNPGIRVYKLLR